MHNDRHTLVNVPVRVEFVDKTANIMSSTMEISRSASLNVATKLKPLGSSFKSKWKSFRTRMQKTDCDNDNDNYNDKSACAYFNRYSNGGGSDNDDSNFDNSAISRGIRGLSIRNRNNDNIHGNCPRCSYSRSWRRKGSKYHSSSCRRRHSCGNKRKHNSLSDEFFIMDSFSEVPYAADELSVKICKENIRQSLLDGLRVVRGNDTLLTDMEMSRLDQQFDKRSFETLNELERNYALLWAAFIGRLDYMEVLHELGADITFTMQGEGGFTALHLSAFSGCVNCIRWLIERGCDPNATHETFTPLHYAVLGNSLESLHFLANQPDVHISNTVLHAAVLANAVDCVQFLMNTGANVAAFDLCGMTPLHIAADRSLVQCLRIMLEHQPEKVDVKTNRRRATTLHLACENGHLQCVKLLLEHNASLSKRNYKGMTALYLAAKAQSFECVEVLLAANADVNARDIELRTPLHAAVCKPQQAFPILELMIKHRAEVNVSDSYGYAPLHLAAFNELADCVDLLIKCGANVGSRTMGGVSALSIINRKTPTSVQAIRKKLDESLSMTEPDGHDGNRELRLKLDFRYIKQNSTCGEIGFLQMLKKEGHRELLQHPICVAFLHLKWEKVRCYYFIRLTFCTFFIVFLSLYVMTALAHDCYNAAEYTRRRRQCNETATEVTNNSIANCTENSLAGTYLIDNQWLMEYIWYALVGCTVLELVRKLYSTPGFSSLHQYFRSLSNVIEWVVMASVFAISCVFFNEIRAWQKQVGAFAVLAGWSILMIMIGQLPVFGTYIAMYTKVQKEFVKLLMAYCCLLIGFTICFCVVFPTKAFGNPLIGFVKVLAMMTGELDVNSLLVEQPPVSPQRELTASAYIAFVLFLFFVTIVLINLLVGIAVHDIEGLHKTAGLSKLVRQTELIYFLELALFHGYLPNCIMEWLKKALFISPGGYRVVVSVRPYSPHEKSIPKEVMEAALAIARSRRRPFWPSTTNNVTTSTPSTTASTATTMTATTVTSIGGTSGYESGGVGYTHASNNISAGGIGAIAKYKDDQINNLLVEMRKTQQMLQKLEEKQTLQKLQELANLLEKLQSATINNQIIR